MTADPAASIQPVVLVGGQSRRFGRDKLREPLGGPDSGTWLVDRPIAALRAVFGPCVALVGDCDPLIAARGDVHLPDRYPGLGPMGGILSALQHFDQNRSIFVLPGDCLAIAPPVITTILHAARSHPGALAILAATGQTEWCVGLYRPAVAPVLAAAIRSQSPSLKRTLSPLAHATVPFTPDQLRDADRPEDLADPRR